MVPESGTSCTVGHRSQVVSFSNNLYDLYKLVPDSGPKTGAGFRHQFQGRKPEQLASVFALEIGPDSDPKNRDQILNNGTRFPVSLVAFFRQPSVAILAAQSHLESESAHVCRPIVFAIFQPIHEPLLEQPNRLHEVGHVPGLSAASTPNAAARSMCWALHHTENSSALSNQSSS